jgi:type IV pilus assembly protein PilM
MNLKQDISFGDVKRLVRLRKRTPSASGARGRDQREEHRELVGLKVGASKLAAAHVVNNGLAQLQQLVWDPMDAGVVVNGEVRDTAALAAKLSEFFTKHNLPRKHVRLGVANSRIGVRWFEVAGVTDEQQLENAIRFRAHELLPIPLEDVVMDHHVLDRYQSESGESVWKILLVVAHRQLIDSYVAACKEAGIELVGIDLEAFALLRALGTSQSGTQAGALIGVSLGHERTTFAVSDGNVCEFARVLNWGGAKLNTTIARTLAIPEDEADRVKRGLSLVEGAPPPPGLTPEQAQKAITCIRTELHSFAHELVSSLQFYQSQPKALPISEIVLTGGTASLPGVDAELQRLVGVSVRVGDPLGRVTVPPSGAPVEPSGALTVAVGLGIEA